MAASALVLAAYNPPMIPEFSTSSSAISLNPATVEHVMEWRPQGPPPWGDVDQLTPEEVEESPAMAAGSGGAMVDSDRGSSDARARPER